MMTDDSEDSIPKVVDFGLSAMVDLDHLATESVGTVAYASPEIFKGEPYSKEVDIWSLGTMFFGCLGGYLPYDDPEKSKIMHRVLNEPLNLTSDRWKKVSSNAKKLL
jgi:serine/threonine protein kinase